MTHFHAARRFRTRGLEADASAHHPHGWRWGACAGLVVFVLLGSAPAGFAQDASSSASQPVQTVPAGRAIQHSAATPFPGPDVAEAPLGTANLPHDLSPWAMFANADVIVKAVMIGLAFASVVTWTIGLAKGLELLFTKRRALAGLRHLQGAHDLQDAARGVAAGGRGSMQEPVAALLRVAGMEVSRSADLPADGIKERVSVALSRIEAQAGRSMARGTGLLATIGSTAPFVGLFGTVWGIMNAFIGISRAQTTNLAVVAPGIAEALLATAIGLVAAIPAVVIYNLFARSIAGYRASLADASAIVLQHVSRDLDKSRSPGRTVAALRAAPAMRPAE